jgi:hypothetical protein
MVSNFLVNGVLPLDLSFLDKILKEFSYVDYLEWEFLTCQAWPVYKGRPVASCTCIQYYF